MGHLAWASASLHHLADPDRTLAQLAVAIRPGGLLVVIELAGLPRFVPDHALGGAVESRAHALLAANRTADMPTMGSDWAPRLTRAGLVVELDRTILVDLTGSTPAVGAYAAATRASAKGSPTDSTRPSEDRSTLCLRAAPATYAVAPTCASAPRDGYGSRVGRLPRRHRHSPPQTGLE